MDDISEQEQDDSLSRRGQPWTGLEEKQLLEEIEGGVDVKQIAVNHRRTAGGIRSRIKLIAYEMYTHKYSMSEIISRTKLTEIQVLEEVKKRGDLPESVWTAEEDEQLLEEIGRNIHIEQIAANHQREVVSIRLRIRLIAYEMYQKGYSVSEVTSKTKLMDAQVVKVICETKLDEIKGQIELINDSIEEISRLVKILDPTAPQD